MRLIPRFVSKVARRLRATVSKTYREKTLMDEITHDINRMDRQQLIEELVKLQKRVDDNQGHNQFGDLVRLNAIKGKLQNLK